MTVAVGLTATVVLFAAASADTEEDIERARALEADGRIDVAVEQLRALATDESREPAAEVLLELARLTDDAREALSLADEALRTARDAGVRARAHMMRGDYLYAAGHYERAAAEYAAAAERGMPDHPLLRQAASLLQIGDIGGAIDVYDRAAEGDSEDVAAWASIGRGRALLAGGELEDAAEELEALAERLAGSATVTHALAAAAEARTALGDLERARELLVSLLAASPGSVEAALAEHRIRVLDTRLAASRSVGADADSTAAPADATPTEDSAPGR